MDEIISISKVLSANDIGKTGSHQAGIVIPKSGPMLNFFPPLDVDEINPRMDLDGVDLSHDVAVLLHFIYYNGRLHGTSTRNEYRLTGLSSFFRRHQAAPGDEMILSRRRHQIIGLALRRGSIAVPQDPELSGLKKIKLSGKWSTYKRKSA